jgi:iron complex transport system permease protein
MIPRPHAPRGRLAALIVLSLAIALAAPFAGKQRISPADVLGGLSDRTEALVFWQLRVPRVCLSYVAGAALAISGMAFQSMFRNPLATPFTMGVASGASLGAALCLRFGLALSILGLSSVPLFSFAGAGLSILLVYGLTRARHGFSPATMLLAGVAVSFFFSSLILFLQYLSDFTQSFRILRWLMGGIEAVGFSAVITTTVFAAAGGLVLAGLTNELNLLATGDDLAISRGVNVLRVKKRLFFATSLMVGGVVSTCGPIGFVGMMAPHICRLLVGPNHRVLLPATLFFGGAFLTLCDTLARTVIAPAEIPVGVITSLLGGPFFLWLLMGSARQRGGFVEE